VIGNKSDSLKWEVIILSGQRKNPTLRRAEAETDWDSTELSAQYQ